MFNSQDLTKLIKGNRRQFLKWGLVTGVGAVGTAVGLKALQPTQRKIVPIPEISDTTKIESIGINPLAFARHFDYGKIIEENGRKIREFRVEARTTPVKLNEAVTFITWNLNGQVPGPTFRATEGDRIRVIFYNKAGGHSHSLHFHGIHEANMDGVRPVRNGSVFIYEFDAKPYGVHLYHCHIAPVTRHISKGLYGMFIIDPPEPRPPADEMVLIMAGYDIDDDQKNELYAFNGLPDYYMHHPIPVWKDQLIRLYVLNMIEFDPVATFHVHANMFQVYRTGRTLTPTEETDVITMGTAERHILELSYPYTGKFMFHPHQDLIAEEGCMGYFDVRE
ncbi:multicopper oxidase domain-containing protein [Chroococcus sp. FPU101]|uniref:multicopper oxidase domain-containing protein n=1 Tax=Chroococcus sp. FPU101 TaxID=1974212 RepID=UPI001A8F6880|nr:multicopper oxidase domain-containing protein [Chroococcus sp. FPU101]GFE69449.1 Multicopper oxidase, types 2 and 3 [Chroococcus sp. FPU101]